MATNVNEECNSLSFKELKALMSVLDIPGRTKISNKIDMCQAIIKFYEEHPELRGPSLNKPRLNGGDAGPTPASTSSNSRSKKQYTRAELESFSYRDLTAILTELGVEGRSKLTFRDDKIDAILKEQAKASQAPQASTLVPTRSQEVKDTSYYQVPDLPVTALKNIISHLSFPDLLSLCQVNQQFAKVCNDDAFWQELYEEDYPTDPIPDDGSTWRARYLTTSKFIHDSAVNLVDNYNRVNPRYSNTEDQIRDSYNHIKDFTADTGLSGYSGEDFSAFIYELLNIITGLNPNYFPDYYEGLIPEIVPYIQGMFNTLGLVNLDEYEAAAADAAQTGASENVEGDIGGVVNDQGEASGYGEEGPGYDEEGASEV